jgi:hypothetical protein
MSLSMNDPKGKISLLCYLLSLATAFISLHGFHMHWL